MNALWAIAFKDIRLLFRDKQGCFFALGFPLIVAVFFGSIFSGTSSSDSNGSPRKTPIGLVDLDQTSGSEAFAKALAAESTLEITRFESTDAAIPKVTGGSLAAAVVLTKGLGASREDPFSGAPMRVEIILDPARKVAGPMLEGILTKAGFAQLQAGFTDPVKLRERTKAWQTQLREDKKIDQARRLILERLFNQLEGLASVMPTSGSGEGAGSENPPAPAASGFTPIQISTTSIAEVNPQGKKNALPTSAFAITFPQGMIWGVMGCALSFAMSLVLERSRGTLVRLRVAPVSALTVIAGKALACLIATMLVSLMVLGVGVVGFGVRPISWPLVMVAIACTGICFVGVMMMLASFSGTERGGSGLGWGVLLILAFIGGGAVPLEFLPNWVRTIGHVSPIKWSIMAIEAGVWRPLSTLQFLIPCAVLLGLGGTGFFIGVLKFGREGGSQTAGTRTAKTAA